VQELAALKAQAVEAPMVEVPAAPILAPVAPPQPSTSPPTGRAFPGASAQIPVAAASKAGKSVPNFAWLILLCAGGASAVAAVVACGVSIRRHRCKSDLLPHVRPS
jgi:hypothetical protein